ncbi:MAG: hypothetical protein VB073_00010 [Proteiniphilum sp.]|nr:hypothetical protein [Proteiniphilum sp.]
MKKNNQTESIPIQQQWNVGLRDTIIKECVGNSFIAYHLQGDSIYSIEWGNNFITNTSKKKFEVLGSGVLGLLEVDENCILLSQSCGTSCVYYVFLPLKMDATEKVYDFVLANDLKKHLIAYIPTDNDTIFIRVENYLTGQIMDVKETNMCQATFKADCIDSIYFNKSSLILKWQGSGWSETKPDPHERTIPVEF